MEYGLGIPTRGPLANRASIETIATRAEVLGFSWLAVPDHLIVPRAIDSRYPYSDSGAFPGSESGECLRIRDRCREAASHLGPSGGQDDVEPSTSAPHRKALVPLHRGNDRLKISHLRSVRVSLATSQPVRITVQRY